MPQSLHSPNSFCHEIIILPNCSLERRCIGSCMVHIEALHTWHVLYYFKFIAWYVCCDWFTRESFLFLIFLSLSKWCVLGVPPIVSFGHWLFGHLLELAWWPIHFIPLAFSFIDTVSLKWYLSW